MSRIHILDCTLRDGGYINDFNFGENTLKDVTDKLSKASIDIIECGFLVSGKNDKNLSLFESVEAIKNVIQIKNPNSLYVAMIQYGKISDEEISQCDGTSIDGIRVTFHAHEIEGAFVLGEKLINKGYKVFMQPVDTMTYTDQELLTIIEKINTLKPFAFYMVDTLGSMYSKNLYKMVYLIDNNLDKNIMLGFHSHNNLQLSFSNAQELMAISSKRDIIIDSSVFGMGRGAGNLCTELLAQYINENIESKYDLIPILEIMDEHIMPIYAQSPWGYSAAYYIAAVNNCHPNYATYLVNLQTLNIRDINSIIKSIPIDQKRLYDKKLISQLYLDYQRHNIDDSQALDYISDLCKDKSVLILAPGKSLLTHSNEITRYISEKNPVVFSVNHIPQFIKYDKLFISNIKRFKKIKKTAEQFKDKLICTSNISTMYDVCKVNYSDYLNDNDIISDNAGLMLINLLKKIGVKTVALAGFDGFVYSDAKNYYNEKMINTPEHERQEILNEAVSDYFKKASKTLDIDFITPTIYKDGFNE